MVDSVSLDEAIALSFNKGPVLVNWNSVKGFLQDGFLFPEEYEERRNLVMRALDAGKLKDPTTPIDFLDWCQKKGVDSPQWRKAIEATQRSVQQPAGPAETEPVKPDAGTAPSVPIEASQADRTAGLSEQGLSKREKQIRTIEAMADKLRHPRMKIPKGGKAELREKCKAEWPELFGAGDNPFLDAWKRAIKDGRILVADHDKYSRR